MPGVVVSNTPITFKVISFINRISFTSSGNCCTSLHHHHSLQSHTNNNNCTRSSPSSSSAPDLAKAPIPPGYHLGVQSISHLPADPHAARTISIPPTWARIPAQTLIIRRRELAGSRRILSCICRRRVRGLARGRIWGWERSLMMERMWRRVGDLAVASREWFVW